MLGEGLADGTLEGALEGPQDGDELGLEDGELDGASDGLFDGGPDGALWWLRRWRRARAPPPSVTTARGLRSISVVALSTLPVVGYLSMLQLLLKLSELIVNRQMLAITSRRCGDN